MLYGPQGAWAEALGDGPWIVEEFTHPFAGWQGAYLRWRPETWPLDAERYLLAASTRHRLPLLGCYVCVSCFGYVVALVPRAIVARYVVDPDGTQAWIEGEWALAQCAADHGLAWGAPVWRHWPAGRRSHPGRRPPSSCAACWLAPPVPRARAVWRATGRAGNPATALGFPARQPCRVKVTDLGEPCWGEPCGDPERQVGDGRGCAATSRHDGLAARAGGQVIGAGVDRFRP
jgi:hypothetical protein